MCSKGFSLLELLVVVAITGIFASIGLTAFNRFYLTQKAKQEAAAFLTVLQSGSAQALQDNIPIVLCGTNDQQHCTSVWTAGVMMFQDKHRTHQRDADDLLIRYLPAFEKGTELTWVSFPKRNDLTFLPEDLSEQQNGTFYFRYATFSEKIIINKAGRVRVEV